jgi:hypothetical protein
MAFVFTVSPKLADPAPGPRPAPELARYDRITTARSGETDPAALAATEDALGVLASVVERDGQQLSATQTRDQALADADHLAVLNAIWAAETIPARDQRYRDLYMSALPPGYRQEPGHQAKWLWRTLRAAELAGVDPAEALTKAIGERDLTGARDIPSVIDARLRRQASSLVPLPAGPWSAQLPAIPDPERRAFAAEIAALMDERKDRIGEHAATSAPAWAVAALGPVPDGQPERGEWQRHAASVGAYRELSGYDHPADPIGPEPVTGPPDLRAAWHEALAALGPVDGPDVRGMPDGILAHLRDTYPIGGLATSFARRAPGTGTLAWPPSARPPRPTPPPGKAAATRPPGNVTWRPATRPCARPTSNAKPSSPPRRRTANAGRKPPASCRTTSEQTESRGQPAVAGSPPSIWTSGTPRRLALGI